MGQLPREYRDAGELTPQARAMFGPSSAIGEKRRLNPRFTEWLMGLPVGWTDAASPIEPSDFARWATASSRHVRRIASLSSRDG
jgi:hypothetical protein